MRAPILAFISVSLLVAPCAAQAGAPLGSDAAAISSSAEGPLVVAPPAAGEASAPSLPVMLTPAAQTTAAAPATPTKVAAPAAQPVSSSGADSYNLGPGDEVRISVFNEPDLKVEQKIDAGGEINMPLVGNVRASGMTSTQLSDALEARLRKGYLLDPNVSVTVLTYRPFYVIGEVERPGSYPFTADLTIASAIATAGGFGRDADRGSVFVKRLGTASEQKMRIQDGLSLQPGDTVRVGRSALSGLRDLPFGLLGLGH